MDKELGRQHNGRKETQEGRNEWVGKAGENRLREATSLAT